MCSATPPVPWRGWSKHHAPIVDEKPTLGMTMFGVTTPCVTAVRETLEARGFDCLVFHATGTGGQAMEKLVEAGLIQGVLDITTTEVADQVVGGILPCGPLRFEAILEGPGSLRALCRCPRHGQLRRDRDRARTVPRPSAPRSQRAGDADANHAPTRIAAVPAGSPASSIGRQARFESSSPSTASPRSMRPVSRFTTRKPTRHFSTSWSRPC